MMPSWFLCQFCATYNCQVSWSSPVPQHKARGALQALACAVPACSFKVKWSPSFFSGQVLGGPTSQLGGCRLSKQLAFPAAVHSPGLQLGFQQDKVSKQIRQKREGCEHFWMLQEISTQVTCKNITDNVSKVSHTQLSNLFGLLLL